MPNSTKSTSSYTNACTTSGPWCSHYIAKLATSATANIINSLLMILDCSETCLRPLARALQSP
jgi:hypothetical protein